MVSSLVDVCWALWLQQSFTKLRAHVCINGMEFWSAYCGYGPPLIHSWIVSVLEFHGALDMNLIVDCSRVVAEANVYWQHNAGILRHPFRGHGAMSQYYQPFLPEWALLFGVCKGGLVVKNCNMFVMLGLVSACSVLAQHPAKMSS